MYFAERDTIREAAAKWGNEDTESRTQKFTIFTLLLHAFKLNKEERTFVLPNNKSQTFDNKQPTIAKNNNDFARLLGESSMSVTRVQTNKIHHPPPERR